MGPSVRVVVRCCQKFVVVCNLRINVYSISNYLDSTITETRTIYHLVQDSSGIPCSNYLDRTITETRTIYHLVQDSSKYSYIVLV